MAVFKTQGLEIAINNGSAFVNIGNVESIQFGGGSAEEYDVTSLASTAKEVLTGFTANGDVTLNMFWNPNNAGQTFLRTSATNTNTVPFLIYLPSSSNANNIAFNLALKNFTPSFEKGPAKATAQGTVSGSITYA